MASLVFPNNKELKDISHIIFDKDGTIFDLDFYWVEMIKIRSQIISQKINNQDLYHEVCLCMGMHESGKELSGAGPVGTKSRKEVLLTVFNFLKEKNISLTTDEISICFDLADEKSLESIPTFLKIIDGVESFLNRCKEHSITLSVVTNDIESRAIKCLDSKNLSTLFEVVLGSDSVENGKPAPDLANIIMEKLNITQSEVLMVGDSSTDAHFTRNSNLREFIGVTTGFYSKNDLLTLTDFVVENLDHITIEN